MPLYEYQCKKCRHRFEKIQKFSDPHIKKCPECGGPLEQLLSPPAVQFKGSGWYVTDYARKAGSQQASSNGSSSEKTAEKKEESKHKSEHKSEHKKTEKKH